MWITNFCNEVPITNFYFFFKENDKYKILLKLY